MPKQEDMPQFKHPIPATDIIIEYNDGLTDGIVLITRKYPPYGVALPGGLAEYGISLEENACKEAWEETGLEVIIENPQKPLCVHSDPERDPRAHLFTVVYVGKGYGHLQAGDDAKTATLFSIDEVKNLLGTGQIAFDHEEIIEKYLGHRGYK